MFWNFYVTKHDECTCKTISVSHYSAMEVMVTFTSTYFMNSTNLFYFNIKVYAGRDMSAPRLAQLCHKQTSEQVLTTTGNLMYVIFRSDVSINGKGFSASYKSIVGGKCYF